MRVGIGLETHALTFVGFREERDLGGDKDIQISINEKPRFRSRGVVRWYVHDDRLGPYARLGFGLDEAGRVSYDKIGLLPTEAGFEEFETEMVFSVALVPLYPKLRLTAEELVEFALNLLPTIVYLSGSDNIYVEPRFCLGGDYLAGLQESPLETRRLVALSTRLVLSRYVGVLRWYVGEDWICHIVYDTTDLRRDSRAHPPILALIPKDSMWIERLETMRDIRFGPLPRIA